MNKKIQFEFRQQIAGYDCAPTAFINALIYLFKREEIPIDVVQGIYVNTLNGGLFHGSSGKDIAKLSKWLKDYRRKNWDFAVDIDHQVGRKANFDKIDLVDENVCCIFRVKIARGFWHYITAFYERDDYVYCYDSYYKTDIKRNNWRVKKMKNGCNLKVKREYLFAEKDHGIYRTGMLKNREFILIKRIKPAK